MAVAMFLSYTNTMCN
ncbi:hypothetical protein ACHAXN_000116 [Cyclotella atomus]